MALCWPGRPPDSRELSVLRPQGRQEELSREPGPAQMPGSADRATRLRKMPGTH